MASCCRRYRARRLKALDDDPKLLVIRPAAPATSLYHFKPFKLSTALMAVHKHCYAPIGLIQQGGPRRRETLSQPHLVLKPTYLSAYIEKADPWEAFLWELGRFRRQLHLHAAVVLLGRSNSFPGDDSMLLDLPEANANWLPSDADIKVCVPDRPATDAGRIPRF